MDSAANANTRPGNMPILPQFLPLGKGNSGKGRGAPVASAAPWGAKEICGGKKSFALVQGRKGHSFAGGGEFCKTAFCFGVRGDKEGFGFVKRLFL